MSIRLRLGGIIPSTRGKKLLIIAFDFIMIDERTFLPKHAYSVPTKSEYPLPIEGLPHHLVMLLVHEPTTRRESSVKILRE